MRLGIAALRFAMAAVCFEIAAVRFGTAAMRLGRVAMFSGAAATVRDRVRTFREARPAFPERVRWNPGRGPDGVRLSWPGFRAPGGPYAADARAQRLARARTSFGVWVYVVRRTAYVS
jgi:hypothetical protein